MMREGEIEALWPIARTLNCALLISRELFHTINSIEEKDSNKEASYRALLLAKEESHSPPIADAMNCALLISKAVFHTINPIEQNDRAKEASYRALWAKKGELQRQHPSFLANLLPTRNALPDTKPLAEQYPIISTGLINIRIQQLTALREKKLKAEGFKDIIQQKNILACAVAKLEPQIEQYVPILSDFLLDPHIMPEHKLFIAQRLWSQRDCYNKPALKLKAVQVLLKVGYIGALTVQEFHQEARGIVPEKEIEQQQGRIIAHMNASAGAEEMPALDWCQEQKQTLYLHVVTHCIERLERSGQEKIINYLQSLASQKVEALDLMRIRLATHYYGCQDYARPKRLLKNQNKAYLSECYPLEYKRLFFAALCGGCLSVLQGLNGQEYKINYLPEYVKALRLQAALGRVLAKYHINDINGIIESSSVSEAEAEVRLLLEHYAVKTNIIDVWLEAVTLREAPAKSAPVDSIDSLPFQHLYSFLLEASQRQTHPLQEKYAALLERLEKAWQNKDKSADFEQVLEALETEVVLLIKYGFDDKFVAAELITKYEKLFGFDYLADYGDPDTLKWFLDNHPKQQDKFNLINLLGARFGMRGEDSPRNQKVNALIFAPLMRSIESKEMSIATVMGAGLSLCVPGYLAALLALLRDPGVRDDDKFLVAHELWIRRENCAHKAEIIKIIETVNAVNYMGDASTAVFFEEAVKIVRSTQQTPTENVDLIFAINTRKSNIDFLAYFNAIKPTSLSLPVCEQMLRFFEYCCYSKQGIERAHIGIIYPHVLYQFTHSQTTLSAYGVKALHHTGLYLVDYYYRNKAWDSVAQILTHIDKMHLSSGADKELYEGMSLLIKFRTEVSEQLHQVKKELEERRFDSIYEVDQYIQGVLAGIHISNLISCIPSRLSSDNGAMLVEAQLTLQSANEVLQGKSAAKFEDFSFKRIYAFLSVQCIDDPLQEKYRVLRDRADAAWESKDGQEITILIRKMQQIEIDIVRLMECGYASSQVASAALTAQYNKDFYSRYSAIQLLREAKPYYCVSKEDAFSQFAANETISFRWTFAKEGDIHLYFAPWLKILNEYSVKFDLKREKTPFSSKDKKFRTLQDIADRLLSDGLLAMLPSTSDILLFSGLLPLDEQPLLRPHSAQANLGVNVSAMFSSLHAIMGLQKAVLEYSFNKNMYTDAIQAKNKLVLAIADSSTDVSTDVIARLISFLKDDDIKPANKLALFAKLWDLQQRSGLENFLTSFVTHDLKKISPQEKNTLAMAIAALHPQVPNYSKVLLEFLISSDIEERNKCALADKLWVQRNNYSEDKSQVAACLCTFGYLGSRDIASFLEELMNIGVSSENYQQVLIARVNEGGIENGAQAVKLYDYVLTRHQAEINAAGMDKITQFALTYPADLSPYQVERLQAIRLLLAQRYKECQDCNNFINMLAKVDVSNLTQVLLPTYKQLSAQLQRAKACQSIQQTIEQLKKEKHTLADMDHYVRTSNFQNRLNYALESHLTALVNDDTYSEELSPLCLSPTEAPPSLNHIYNFLIAAQKSRDPQRERYATLLGTAEQIWETKESGYVLQERMREIELEIILAMEFGYRVNTPADPILISQYKRDFVCTHANIKLLREAKAYGCIDRAQAGRRVATSAFGTAAFYPVQSGLQLCFAKRDKSIVEQRVEFDVRWNKPFGYLQGQESMEFTRFQHVADEFIMSNLLADYELERPELKRLFDSLNDAIKKFPDLQQNFLDLRTLFIKQACQILSLVARSNFSKAVEILCITAIVMVVVLALSFLIWTGIACMAASSFIMLGLSLNAWIIGTVIAASILGAAAGARVAYQFFKSDPQRAAMQEWQTAGEQKIIALQNEKSAEECQFTS